MNSVEALELVRQELVDEPAIAEYFDYHAERFVRLLELIETCRDSREVNRVLDIGPSVLTYVIHTAFPDLRISTLGWGSPPGSDFVVESREFDLNQSDQKTVDFDEAPFDLVIFGETIEHLHTSPTAVLPVLKQLMKPAGARLIVQTPNATTLVKRTRMLSGRHPYEKLRLERYNPGHIREYTRSELIEYAVEAGFKVLSAEYCDYWHAGNPILAFLERHVPSFQQGLMLTLET